MDSTAGIGGGRAGPWYRVQAIMAAGSGTAERDYALVLPAALNAALRRRPFVAGWLSRGGGAPLELISNAGPLPDGRPHARDDGTGPQELLFPWGARGVRLPGSLLADLDRLVWAPCPGRQALPLGGDQGHQDGPWAAGRPPLTGQENGTQGGRDRAAGQQQATLFESALTTLISRPFGWLVVAEPTARLDAETADLRTQLNVLRRYDEEHARFDADRAQRRLAELDAFREAGLWNVRVLAGAATEDELRLIAPVLVGSIDLGAHPYRLRSVAGARDLADALVTKHLDASDGAEVPFAATAGALVALTGLPRLEVPGVRVLHPGYFDLTSETGQTAGEQAIELGAILDVADRPVGAFRVPAGHAEPARLRHRRHRRREVPDGQAPARAADRGGHSLAGHRAGEVGVRGDGGPYRRRGPGHGHQPGRPGRGAAVGEPARAGAWLPGTGAHRHGAGPVPGRLRRS